jgi:hypothetical protein
MRAVDESREAIKQTKAKRKIGIAGILNQTQD